MAWTASGLSLGQSERPEIQCRETQRHRQLVDAERSSQRGERLGTSLGRCVSASHERRRGQEVVGEVVGVAFLTARLTGQGAKARAGEVYTDPVDVAEEHVTQAACRRESQAGHRGCLLLGPRGVAVASLAVLDSQPSRKQDHPADPVVVDVDADERCVERQHEDTYAAPSRESGNIRRRRLALRDGQQFTGDGGGCGRVGDPSVLGRSLARKLFDDLGQRVVEVSEPKALQSVNQDGGCIPSVLRPVEVLAALDRGQAPHHLRGPAALPALPQADHALRHTEQVCELSLLHAVPGADRHEPDAQRSSGVDEVRFELLERIERIGAELSVSPLDLADHRLRHAEQVGQLALREAAPRADPREPILLRSTIVLCLTVSSSWRAGELILEPFDARARRHVGGPAALPPAHISLTATKPPAELLLRQPMAKSQSAHPGGPVRRLRVVRRVPERLTLEQPQRNPEALQRPPPAFPSDDRRACRVDVVSQLLLGPPELVP